MGQVVKSRFTSLSRHWLVWGRCGVGGLPRVPPQQAASAPAGSPAWVGGAASQPSRVSPSGSPGRRSVGSTAREGKGAILPRASGSGVCRRTGTSSSRSPPRRGPGAGAKVELVTGGENGDGWEHPHRVPGAASANPIPVPGSWPWPSRRRELDREVLAPPAPWAPCANTGQELSVYPR